MMVDEQDPSKTATVADPVDDMDWMISKSEDGALELALETYQEPMAGGFPPGVEHGFQAAMLSEVEAVFESDLPLELPEMEMVVAGSPSFSEEDYPFNDMFSDLDHRLRAAATVALLDAEVAAVDADAVIAERDADVEETTAAPPDTPEPLIVQERHIIFSLTGKRYAVPIRNVIEVGELSNLTPVPNVPAWVKGVTNLRGDIISVVDFRAYLGMQQESRPEMGSMIVVRTLGGDLTTGLLVDRDLGMTTVAAGQLRSLEGDAEGELAPYLHGVYEDGEELLGVLNMEGILQALAVVN